MDRGDDEGALSDFDKAVSSSGGSKSKYFVQRARARARVAMRSAGREEALAGVQVRKWSTSLSTGGASACSEFGTRKPEDLVFNFEEISWSCDYHQMWIKVLIILYDSYRTLRRGGRGHTEVSYGVGS